jgi:uncharacterized damage-inducible protein DinB
MSLPSTCAVRLQAQLECLPILLAGIRDDALDHKPASSKWSARENLAHLARYHEIFLERMRRIGSEDRPLLPRYRAEDDLEWPHWRALPAPEVLSRLHALRAQLLQRTAELPDSVWPRIGLHSHYGAMTLVQWLEFFLLHEAHHLLCVLQRVRE